MPLPSKAKTTLLHSRIVERYAHFLARPEERLRFLRHTLTLQAENRERLDEFVARHPSIARSKYYQRHYARLLDLMLYRLIVRELGRLLPSSAGERLKLLRQHKAPRAARVYFSFYRVRHVIHVALVAAFFVSLFGAYTATAWSARRVNTYLSKRFERRVLATDAASPNSALAGAVNHLRDYRPEKVWLVESRDGYERYSNGGRIITEFETGNRPRGFVALPRSADLTRVKVSAGGAEVQREPVGIVYHTSESDMLPFTPDQNDSIEARSRGLLEYVRRHKSYNYLIDRFGQIYRVVRDEDAAHHAGNSVWADEKNLYVGLNESFIGVCFETSMSAETPEEQLTEAQVVAGRLLTQIIRSRHQIDDANCVTHGLVSVNPSSMLICFHYDWARNFPFEAMGLSDKYKIAPASVSHFGFTYDDEVVATLGGALWSGVKVAEDEFNARAAGERTTPEELRARMRERFREQMNLSYRFRGEQPREGELSREQRRPAGESRGTTD
ncbi:MAG TPA: peptidoglycan recognition family protein [Pyrinomonadaceae bacterium]|nr:peptidoglycan recognition family protein [Pyrinomonadaceae bacterium]